MDFAKNIDVVLSPDNPLVKLVSRKDISYSSGRTTVIDMLQQGLTDNKIHILLELGGVTTVIAASELTQGWDTKTSLSSMKHLEIGINYDSLSLRLTDASGGDPSDTVAVKGKIHDLRIIK